MSWLDNSTQNDTSTADMSRAPALTTPPGWTSTTLGSVCESPQYGWTTRAKNDWAGLRLLRTTDITRGPIVWSSVPACDRVPDDPEKYLLKDGDIVISRAGSIGVSSVIRQPPPAVFGSYLIRFRPLPGVLSSYLGYFLQSQVYRRQVEAKAVGIALKNLNARKLSAVHISLAPSAEQIRIVQAIEARFTRLDTAVAALERVRTNLTRYRASTLEAAASGKLAPTSEPPRFPISQFVVDLRHGWSPQCDSVPCQSSDEWGVIKTTAVQSMAFLDRHHKRLPSTLPPRPSLEIRQGDLLITCAGPRARCGVTCLVKHVRPRLMASGKVYRIRLDERRLLAAFAEVVLNSPSYTRLLDAMKTGISDSGLNLTEERFGSLPMPTPALETQRTIVADVERCLSVADEAAADVDAGQAHCARIRQSVLKNAFEGRLVAQDPNDEPATTLLARLGASYESPGP